MMGAREELFAQGFPYMRIVGAFAFFQAVSLSAAAGLRSVDKAHYPMFVSGLAALSALPQSLHRDIAT